MKLKTTPFAQFLAIGLVSAAFAPQLSAATLVDLIGDNSGAANGALYRWADEDQLQSFTITPFLGLQNSPTEQAYNTSQGTPWDIKANVSTELQVKDLLSVSYNGSPYYGFVLNVSEKQGSGGEYVTLNQVQIFTRPTLLTNPSNSLAGLGTLRFNMDSGAQGDTSVDIDGGRNAKNGPDVVMYVPTSLFSGASSNDYVYFYTQLGAAGYTSDDGVDNWALTDVPPDQTAPAAVPEPTTVALALLGLTVVAFGFRTRRAS